MNFAEWLLTKNKRGTFAFGQAGSLTATAHAGLWFDRFGSTWAKQEGPTSRPRYRLGPSSIDWVLGLDRRAVGQDDEIAAYSGRIAALVHAQGGRMKNFSLAEWSKFISGVGIEHPIDNGFAWHRTLGTPYLPGSGVKGVVKAWARDWAGADAIACDRIFGRGPEEIPGSVASAGSVCFLDAVPVDPPSLSAEVLTPHGPGDNAPEDAGEPNPIGFLAVARATFRFSVLPSPTRGLQPPATPRADPPEAPTPAMDDVDQVIGWLTEAVATIGTGARTKSGYGRLQPAS